MNKLQKTILIVFALYVAFNIGKAFEYKQKENSIFDIEHIEIQENYKASDGIVDIWTGNAQYMYDNGKITLVQKWETN